MKDQSVLAAINLHGVLRNIEDLCEMDAEAAELIKGQKLAIKFSVPGIEKMILAFNDGHCKATAGDGPSDLNLRFKNADHFNKMIDGKANPTPTKGFLKLGFLMKVFPKLAERLTAYLKAEPKALEADKTFRDKSTILTAYTAFNAISMVGNYDPIGRACAKRIEDGSINISIDNSVGVHLDIRNGQMRTSKGLAKDAKAMMRFSDIDVADGILRGTLDSYACIGNGKLGISGRIPMVDNLNKILGIVATYLG
ncbi:MAG: hypothetical protein VB108_07060 [Anaerolineaceae bacterium]|nr:hypothetical protein [Anaerolineaceae bacterium]